jgi:hypothetical protein
LPLTGSRFSNRAKTICKEDLVKATQAVDDALLSTRSLISKQESTVIITDPREYQIELFERAKKQNIIAVLDTGKRVYFTQIWLCITDWLKGPERH